MDGLPSHRDTVLLVDDEHDSLRLMRDALEAAGITVLIATSGEAAVKLLAHIVPDLIVMDAVMPGMDGFETTVTIKKNPKLAHIPIIFMTGLTESEHVVEAFEVGGVDYVRKPANIQELLARVRVHAAHGRVRHASVASLDATGRLMLATDTRGRFLWCTPLAERAIERVAPGWSKEEEVLPLPLQAAVQRLLARGSQEGSVRVEQPLGTLELVLIAQHRDDNVLVRLNELNPDEHAARLKTRLQVTDREAEVLLWLSYGKSSIDISDVLSISPRTVQKHLERIFEKLGVETRAAAAALAIRAIDR